MYVGSLAEHTSFGIGGLAEIFVLSREEDAGEATSVPHVVLGRGTNVLVSDEGVRRRVVLNRLMSVVFDGERVRAGSGACLAALAAMCADRGLSGLEWACGIPGSVGGAVVMNAGAYGGCMAEHVSYVDVLRGGKKVRLSAEECGFGYRTSGFGPTDFVLGAEIKVRAEDRRAILGAMRGYTLARTARQPQGKSAGSVYKRADLPAGAYIERAGLAGAREGGAVISEKHANFIINTGGATARDVLRLMERAEEAVLNKFGVALEREIRLIGEF